MWLPRHPDRRLPYPFLSIVPVPVLRENAFKGKDPSVASPSRRAARTDAPLPSRPREEDLPLPRGKLNVRQQIACHAGRADRLARLPELAVRLQIAMFSFPLCRVIAS